MQCRIGGGGVTHLGEQMEEKKFGCHGIPSQQHGKRSQNLSSYGLHVRQHGLQRNESNPKMRVSASSGC